MSSLPGALLSGNPALHNPTTKKKSVTIFEDPSCKAKSNTSLVTPLLRLVRSPAESLEQFLESFSVAPSSGSLPTSLIDDANTRKLLLQHRMENAEDYLTWRTAAAELDTIEGNDAWRLSPESPHYDNVLLEKRLEELNYARISGDPKRILHLLRTSLGRALGNMGDLNLYKHTRIGTKKLIDDYISATCDTIRVLLDQLNRNDCEIDRRDALQQLLSARQSFGRSALLLSGGGTFGMSHIGVIKSLWEANLLPRIICGSSAGSIICSVLCARTDDELEQTLEEMCHGDLDVFERQGEQDTLMRKAARLAKYGSLFDIQHLTRVMKGLLGDLTFQEAYFRTGRLLNISVSSAGLHELPRLLNYVTAPNVIIWSAVAASCSVPLVFTPAIILAKDRKTGESIPWNPSRQLWIDGSVDNDLPMTRLAEMFNVNHFIVSQVNPHVVPFLVGEESVLPNSTGSADTAVTPGSSWLNTLASFAKSEALHRMHVLTELGVFPNYLTKVRSVLSQKYAGDITILPEVSYAQFPRILRNPTPEFMQTSMKAGERATWLHLARIQNHCAIELALDKATQELRTNIAFSSSQVDLRLMTLAPDSTSTIERERPRPKAKTKSWCAEPGQGFQSSLEMTPTTSHKTRADVDQPQDADWTSSNDAETTAQEDASDAEDDEYLSFNISRRRRLQKHVKNLLPSSDPSQPDSPGALSPKSLVSRLSPRRLFPHGSNPSTPKHYFQSLSNLSGANQDTGFRWALSPADEEAGFDLTTTNSMPAEVPTSALGVTSQADGVDSGAGKPPTRRKNGAS